MTQCFICVFEQRNRKRPKRPERPVAIEYHNVQVVRRCSLETRLLLLSRAAVLRYGMWLPVLSNNTEVCKRHVLQMGELNVHSPTVLMLCPNSIILDIQEPRYLPQKMDAMNYKDGCRK